MDWNIILNESAMNISNVYPGWGSTERYVTIQSCKDYVAVTQFWNYAFEFMLGFMTVLLIWALYKLGKLKAEEKSFKDD